MSRNLNALFQDEAAELQQAQIFHLITVEITTLAFATGSAGSYTVEVSDTAEFSEGQYIIIDGVDGLNQVMAIDAGSKVVSLAYPIDAYVAEAPVRLQLALADSNYSVTYDGVTYVQFPAKFSEINVSSDGTIDKASLSVANVSREIMYYVEMYDGLRDKRVSVKTVFQKFLDYSYELDIHGNVTVDSNPDADPTAYVEDMFSIDSYTATDTVVVFQLDPAVNMSVKVPHRRYTSDSCYWRYRDADTCGFDLYGFLAEENLIGEASLEEYSVCNKSLADCVKRKNTAKFGGFPGITGPRRVAL